MSLVPEKQPPLLEVRGLTVTFAGRNNQPLVAVRGVDLTVEDGEILGLVGESGSGKSVTMLAVMGLLAPSARVAGSVKFRGEELLDRSQRFMRRYRGAKIGYIFQDPMTALNPLLKIGAQLVEAVRIHNPRTTHQAARQRAVDLLRLVAIPSPETRAEQYPHEFSGGMRQRVVVAMAMANDPQLLIADEPTTALDVTIQAQIIELLQRLREEKRLGLVLVTHDLGVVAGTADRVAIMYAGRVVERGMVDDAFREPHHPYTRGLLASLPRLDARVSRLTAIAGSPPSPASRPDGCAFHPRCPLAFERCQTDDPALRPVGATVAACHLAERVPGTAPQGVGAEA